MTLLQAIALVVRVRDLLPLRSASAQVCASTLEESSDRASAFGGRKSRLRAYCCNTSARPARGARRDLRWLERSWIRIARGRYVPLNAAGWQFFFFQAEDGIRDLTVTGVQTCALPI